MLAARHVRLTSFGVLAALIYTAHLGPAAEKPPAAQRRANRLAKETSPYLLLHAHNPVDWYAWGEESLSKAKAEGKLIFLSIGYSSCYWCHVMERESFMDDEIAALSERTLRLHQGRPRGTARYRRDLYDGRADSQPPRRLAAFNVPDAPGQAVFWRHLLSAPRQRGRGSRRR